MTEWAMGAEVYDGGSKEQIGERVSGKWLWTKDWVEESETVSSR